MKNSMTITNNVVQQVTCADDGTNRLFINDTEIPSTDWVGSGSYTYGSITIDQIADLSGNIQLSEITATHYALVRTVTGSDISGDVVNTFDTYSTEYPDIEERDTVSTLFGKIKKFLADLKSKVNDIISNYLKLSGGTLSGRLTANGKVSVPTDGGTWISQKNTDKASIKVTTKAVTDGSRYDSIIGGMSTDDSTWSIGIIDNVLHFGRYASNQTANDFTNEVWMDLVNGYVSKANVANSVSRAAFGDSGHGEHDANNIASNGLYYYTSNGPATSLGMSTNDAALYCQAYNTTWVAQIAQDYRNGTLCVRGKNNGTWSSWKRILDSTQYDSAATANKLVMRDGNGYVKAVYYNSSNGTENPASYTSYAAFVDSNGWHRKSTLANFKAWLGFKEGTTYTGHLVTWNSGVLCSSGIAASTINEKVGSYASGTSWEKVNYFLKFYGSGTALLQNAGGSNFIWTISSWSDARIKKNIKDTDVIGLEKINAIKIRQFDFKDEARGTHKEIGYVAQELQEVVPDCVVNVPDEEFEDGLLYVEDKPLIPYLVKAVQELSAKIESLENKLKQMEGEKTS